MLEKLTQDFSSLVAKLARKKKLTSENIAESVRSLRLALIEADVNIAVIKRFLDELSKRALGTEVLQGLRPADTFIKFVHDGLVELLGGNPSKGLTLAEPTRLTQVLVSGLQGSGKTTTIAKLALKYKTRREILLVSLDYSRPAAALQLQRLAEQLGVSCLERGKETRPLKLIKQAQRYARKHSHNLIIYDTAGRTQLDTSMLSELKAIYKAAEITESLFVMDAMLGQQALKVAEAFKAALPLTGLIFTKFDSDTSGGALLSVRYTLAVPIHYVGTGEQLADLTEFVPARVAERILGMGDVVALVEKAEQALTPNHADTLAAKLARNEFDLEVMLMQLQQVGKMGSLKSLVKLLPGMGTEIQATVTAAQDQEMLHFKAVIQSMTATERRKPFILNNSRKQRIAKGAGATVLKVNQLLKRFARLKSMMKKFKRPEQLMQLLQQQSAMPATPAIAGAKSLSGALQAPNGMNAFAQHPMFKQFLK